MMSEHKNIYMALASAQSEMDKAEKRANNPHFKSKYADLADVRSACFPALNAHGIAIVQSTGECETGRYVETELHHGQSETSVKCRVPLIIQKNDMQGYGSAVTYARRYGLMALAGIAPEDDDGNAAARAAPKPKKTSDAQMKEGMSQIDGDLIDCATITDDQLFQLRDLIDAKGADVSKVCAYFKINTLPDMPAKSYDAAVGMLQKFKGGA